MPRPIEDYALIGDLHSAALVGSDGSIDWLCLPRFDSAACFAALLGEDRHGHWRISPADGNFRVRRRYRPDTLVLETEFDTDSGTVRLTDCMPPRDQDPVLVRLIEGVSGTVDLRMTLEARFEYGSARPRFRQRDEALGIVAGPAALWLFAPVHIRRSQGIATAELAVSQGDRVPLAAVWRNSRADPPGPPSGPALIDRTERWWRSWVASLSCGGEWREAVVRSLITVKALTYAPTGGVIAAPTTSLPQDASGSRNWDYRYCWLRDAAATLRTLLRSGAPGEAAGLLGWILHAVEGQPSQVQGRYGLAGERLLPEIELGWLPGHDGAQPVRIGTAWPAGPQLSVFGEVQTARLAARMAGLAGSRDPWDSGDLLSLLESTWREPDTGIWEVRGPPRQFVQSKVMVWAAANAVVQMAERFGDPGPAERWRRLRAEVRADVLDRGYDAGADAFVQAYDRPGTDASLLRLAQAGFLPPGDERLKGTASLAARELDRGGVLLRYVPDPGDSLDGLSPGNGCYLPGTFWLAECLALIGRGQDARRVFTRLLELRNDVGLLSEGYDPLRGRLAGNFPLTASHVALAESAAALDALTGPG
jgi:GH15 family glucan-1,4-alpha-glucosidase